MKAQTFIAILLSLSLISCEEKLIGYKYNTGSLPTNPVNLVDFNSEYDDYNASAPTLGRLIPFCFSTNRRTSGGNFDVIYEPMDVSFDKTTGVLTVLNTYGGWGNYAEEYNVLNNGLFQVNTTANEFGPYVYIHLNDPAYGYLDFAILYATDISGNFQIKYTHNHNDSTSDFSESSPVQYLNSPFDDLYPSFDDDFKHIYFCSNRENELFDIYSVEIDGSSDEIFKVLADTNDYAVTKNAVLSSDHDDKCPYIFENMLVFTSNRPGGFGGYDLYFSTFKNNSWSTPQNFGASINTEFDEYRPILFEEGVDHNRHMMVFSSDREGGMGGFDLYFVGVDKEP